VVKSSERRENRRNENIYKIIYVGGRLSLLLMSVDGGVVGHQLATLSNHVPRARSRTRVFPGKW